MSSSTSPSSPPDHSRYSPYISIYGPLMSRVFSSRVLVVGAGGIGCELLKNLALSGFHNIDLIDLDTIDISNLNRQFLFRRHHVGQSKSLVARSAALALNEKLEIRAYHGNIKDNQFGLDYFKQFDLVLNALDNLDARRHVNRLCLASSIPLIESGTQGFLGQTAVIEPGRTECFECQPIAAQKTYPVCTIRNTPDKPIHTIVWAKHIFNAIFGPKDAENPLNDFNQAIEGANHETAGEKLFDFLFRTEIEKQLEVEDRWVGRTPPKPLVLKEILSNYEGKTKFRFDSANDEVRCLTVDEASLFFLDTVSELFLDHRDSFGELSFDKDNRLAMDFVSAASNLRMFIYSIPMQSRFAVKGIAGNIIHAIATTNAIAAGLIVHSAILLLTEQREKCQNLFISRTNPLLTGEPLAKPNPKCYVCSAEGRSVTLIVDTSKFTLRQLFDKVFIGKLSFADPILDIFSADNFLGTRGDIDEEHPEDELDDGQTAFFDRSIESPGILIRDGAQLSVDDQLQSLTVKIRVQHQANLDEEEFPDGFKLIGNY